MPKLVAGGKVSMEKQELVVKSDPHSVGGMKRA